jgi:disulfide bond formation protein DsbB
MSRANRYLAIVVLAIGLAGIGIGIGFVVEAQVKSNWMKQQMRAEGITLGLSADQIAKGDVVDTAAEAQKAADTVRQHRHEKYGTYNEVTGGQGFDPSNPTEVTYMQALNLENYLYLAVSGFGLATVVLASGIFMIIVGIALGAGGLVMLRPARVPAAA